MVNVQAKDPATVSQAWAPPSGNDCSTHTSSHGAGSLAPDNNDPVEELLPSIVLGRDRVDAKASTEVEENALSSTVCHVFSVGDEMSFFSDLDRRRPQLGQHGTVLMMTIYIFCVSTVGGVKENSTYL